MKNITVKASLVRAAMAVQARGDIRHYLNGFLLSAAGKIAGTNGHTLFHGTYLEPGGEAVDRDVIIHVFGSIPVTAKTVTFNIPEIGETKRGYCFTDNDKAFVFDLIDANFPNFMRAIPKRDRRTFSNGICINASYVAQIEKVFGKSALIEIHMGAQSESIVVTHKYTKGKTDVMSGELVIMPCRTEKQFLTATVPSKEAPNENHAQRPGVQNNPTGIVTFIEPPESGTVPARH